MLTKVEYVVCDEFENDEKLKVKIVALFPQLAFVKTIVDASNGLTTIS